MICSFSHLITKIKPNTRSEKYVDTWPTKNTRPVIMHFRRLAFNYTE